MGKVVFGGITGQVLGTLQITVQDITTQSVLRLKISFIIRNGILKDYITLCPTGSANTSTTSRLEHLGIETISFRNQLLMVPFQTRMLGIALGFTDNLIN